MQIFSLPVIWSNGLLASCVHFNSTIMASWSFVCHCLSVLFLISAFLWPFLIVQILSPRLETSPNSSVDSFSSLEEAVRKSNKDLETTEDLLKEISPNTSIFVHPWSDDALINSTNHLEHSLKAITSNTSLLIQTFSDDTREIHVAAYIYTMKYMICAAEWEIKKYSTLNLIDRYTPSILFLVWFLMVFLFPKHFLPNSTSVLHYFRKLWFMHLAWTIVVRVGIEAFYTVECHANCQSKMDIPKTNIECAIDYIFLLRCIALIGGIGAMLIFSEVFYRLAIHLKK